MQSWLNIREIMSTNCIVDLVIKYSKSMGYNIIPNRIPADFKGSAFKLDKLIASEIASIELPEEFDMIYKLDI